MSENSFWGPHELKENQSGHWVIGPLHLWMTRFPQEWRILYRHTGDPYDRSVHIQIPYNTEDIPVDHNYIKRFCVKKTTGIFHFVPVLPNLPLVVRPEDAFHLPPKEETQLFINSTLWLRIQIDKDTVLDEFPIYRLADTWFGPSTLEGEFCYAAKISAKIQFESLTLSPFRSITKVYIKNLSNTSLYLDKIKIPMPNLCLFKSERGLFFTESVVFQRSRSGEQVRMSFGRTPKTEGGSMIKLNEPREALESHFVAKTLHSLFSRSEDIIWKNG